MVVIENAFIAEMNAQMLASTLAAWIETGEDGYFELTYRSDDGRTRRAALVRPVKGAAVSEFANTGEYVQCETNKGEKIGLLVPRYEARVSHDVIVLTNPRS